MKNKEKEVLIKLDSYFGKLGLDFVLVGARALSLQLNINKDKFRHTEDIDFTINIDSWKTFSKVKKGLQKLGFQTNVFNREHCFKYESVFIDIIPYGENLHKKGKMTLPESQKDMDVTGFNLLFDNSRKMEIDNIEIDVVTIPLLVLTKILAYLDREAKKDLIDIFYALRYYKKPPESEERFEITSKENITYEKTGAYLLAQDLDKLANKQIIEIINRFNSRIEDKYSKPIQKVASSTSVYNEDEESIFTLFDTFKRKFEK